MHLGNFTQTLLVFGGSYSNLPATLALKAEAEKRGIPADHIICTGDIVAYCGQAAETVDCIQQWDIHVLMGNCEESFATDAEDCGCGFDEGSSCDLLSVEWFNFAKKTLRQDQCRWFAQLPRKLTLNFNNKKLRVVHGSISNINDFLFASSPEILFQDQLQQSDADIVIAGHCGIPFSKMVGTQLWYNAGAIGMPANDGTTRTWFSTISFSKNKIVIDSHELHYDYISAHHAMVDAGLRNGYAEAICSGLWPTMDVLPKTERQQQGRALQTTTTVFPTLL